VIITSYWSIMAISQQFWSHLISKASFSCCPFDHIFCIHIAVGKRIIPCDLPMPDKVQSQHLLCQLLPIVPAEIFHGKASLAASRNSTLLVVISKPSFSSSSFFTTPSIPTPATMVRLSYRKTFENGSLVGMKTIKKAATSHTVVKSYKR